MNQFKQIEADIIIRTNTKTEAIKQLVSGGYFTSANKASKYYYKVKMIKGE